MSDAPAAPELALSSGVPVEADELTPEPGALGRARRAHGPGRRVDGIADRIHLTEEKARVVDDIPPIADHPYQPRLTLDNGDDDGVRQPDIDPGRLHGRQPGERLRDPVGAEAEEIGRAVHAHDPAHGLLAGERRPVDLQVPRGEGGEPPSEMTVSTHRNINTRA